MLIAGTGRRSVHKRLGNVGNVFSLKPSFSLPLLDLGGGAVNLNPLFSVGNGTPTFTRATTAYTVNSAGTLVQVSSGVARSYYDPTTLAYLGYLAEGLRTNAQTYSQDISQAIWGNIELTKTAGAAVAPDGTTTAGSLVETIVNAAHQTTQSLPGINGTTYTTSVFAKIYGGGRYTTLGMTDQSTGGVYAYFDLQGGVISQAVVNGGSWTGGVASIIPYPNGWYRLIVTGVVGANNNASSEIYLSNAATGTETPAYIGNTANGIYVWGLQREAAAFASSYIPTTTTALARNASIDQYVSAGNLNAAAMTIALDWTPEAAAMGTVFMFGTYVDASNYTAILHDGTNVTARKRIGGTNHDATKALSYAAGTTYRIVGRFDSTNGVDVWVAGVKGTGDTTTTASQIGTNFQVGADGNSLQQAFGAIRRFAVYPKGLTDSQAAAL